MILLTKLSTDESLFTTTTSQKDGTCTWPADDRDLKPALARRTRIAWSPRTLHPSPLQVQQRQLLMLPLLAYTTVCAMVALVPSLQSR